MARPRFAVAYRHPGGPNGDSFWVRVDDREWTRWDDTRTRRGSWEWEVAPDHEREDAPPKRFELREGSHTLTVGFREADAKLDEVVVTGIDSPPVVVGEPANE